MERDGVSRGTETPPGRGGAEPEESATLLGSGGVTKLLPVSATLGQVWSMCS